MADKIFAQKFRCHDIGGTREELRFQYPTHPRTIRRGRCSVKRDFRPCGASADAQSDQARLMHAP